MNVLREGAACPVCLELRRAWIEWARWLAASAGFAARYMDDRLPTCPEHVWALVDGSEPKLAIVATRHALLTVTGEVAQALRLLRAPATPLPNRLTDRAREALLGPRRRLNAARTFLLRPVVCPICDRLSKARDRTSNCSSR